MPQAECRIFQGPTFQFCTDFELGQGWTVRCVRSLPNHSLPCERASSYGCPAKVSRKRPLFNCSKHNAINWASSWQYNKREWLQVQAAEEKAALGETLIRDEVSAEMSEMLKEIEATYKVRQSCIASTWSFLLSNIPPQTLHMLQF